MKRCIFIEKWDAFFEISLETRKLLVYNERKKAKGADEYGKNFT